MTELDELVQPFLVTFCDCFHLTIRKISHPASNSETSRPFSYRSSKKNSVNYAANHDSCASRRFLNQLDNPITHKTPIIARYMQQNLGCRRRNNVGDRRLGHWLLSYLNYVQNKVFGFQPIHGRESVEGHVDVSSILRFESQTFSDENIPCPGERDQKIPDCSITANRPNGNNGAFHSRRFDMRRRNYLRGLGRTVLGGVLLGRLSGFHRFSGFSLLPMFLVHFSRGRSLLCWHVTARLDIGWDLG